MKATDYFKNNYFTHRDFHVSNIMRNNNKLGVIDSQDAIIGNPLYDVASLIDDVRIKLPQDLQNKLGDTKIYQSNLLSLSSRQLFAHTRGVLWQRILMNKENSSVLVSHWQKQTKNNNV